jgi:thiol-disulfide isomerase/thioredoxin
MDLHQMFSTAVADLPDLPDQVPAAERIHHRRTAMRRTGTVAAATALVVGVGTLTIASPWSSHPSATTVQVAAGATNTASSSDGGEPRYVNVQTGITRIPVGHRQTMPALSGTTLQGKATKVSYPGHVTVVNVWGSWCTPCREEAPGFAKAYGAYASKGVEFVGIDSRDDNAAALAYDSSFGIKFPSLRDPDATLVLALDQITPATAVPSTLIVDSSGKVAVRVIGGITEPKLAQEIAYALAGS